MFGDRPWLGVGFGNYEAVYPAYAIGIWRDPLGHAHNYYLNVAAEAGLIGLAAYLAVLAAALALAGRATARTSGLARRKNRLTPMSVPVVPSPATKCVIEGRSSSSSGPVPSSCARALAGLPYW